MALAMKLLPPGTFQLAQNIWYVRCSCATRQWNIFLWRKLGALLVGNNLGHGTSLRVTLSSLRLAHTCFVYLLSFFVMPSPHIFGLLENKQLAKKETFTSAKDLILEQQLCIEGHQLPLSSPVPHVLPACTYVTLLTAHPKLPTQPTPLPKPRFPPSPLPLLFHFLVTRCRGCISMTACF